MDFGLSDDQQAWHDASIQFAREELAADLDLDARDETRTFWREGLGALCPVRHPGVADPDRIRRPRG